jgi:rod shape-determining protein MreC
VEYTSDNYATVLSVLNTKFQTVAKIKKNNHFGTLSWNGKATGFMQLTDIPRLTDLKKGDTIVTGFSSKAFPENIPIGEVETMFLDKKTNNVTLEVRLFNDMTNLNYVYITDNLHKEEIQTLEEKTTQDE